MVTLTLILLYVFHPIFVSYLIRAENREPFNIGGIWLCFSIWGAVYFIISIINLVHTLKLIKKQNKIELKKRTEIIKLGSIPFWIINFIVFAVFGYLVIFFSMGILFFIIPILIFFTYIILLGTSIFSIPYIYFLYKENEIRLIEMVFHIILQLCFVLDIIDVIYLKIKISKKNKIVSYPNGT